MDVFVSVGSNLSSRQNTLVDALEDQLRRIELSPHTVGRNNFSSKAPLDAVTDLMNTCSGVVIVALERFYFPRGEERRGSSKHQMLTEISLPTPWNQIEAAMAHSRGLPLLVIIDERLRQDGLLGMANGWYVHVVDVESETFNSPAFTQVLSDWRTRLVAVKRVNIPDPATLTLRELFGALKPAQLWAILVAIVGALGVAFAVGAKLFS